MRVLIIVLLVLLAGKTAFCQPAKSYSDGRWTLPNLNREVETLNSLKKLEGRHKLNGSYSFYSTNGDSVVYVRRASSRIEFHFNSGKELTQCSRESVSSNGINTHYEWRFIYNPDGLIHNDSVECVFINYGDPYVLPAQSNDTQKHMFRYIPLTSTKKKKLKFRLPLQIKNEKGHYNF